MWQCCNGVILRGVYERVVLFAVTMVVTSDLVVAGGRALPVRRTALIGGTILNGGCAKHPPLFATVSHDMFGIPIKAFFGFAVEVPAETEHGLVFSIFSIPTWTDTHEKVVVELHMGMSIAAWKK